MSQCAGSSLVKSMSSQWMRRAFPARCMCPNRAHVWYSCGGGCLTTGSVGSQRSDDQQFLFETTVEAGVTETVKEMVEVHNLRLRIQR
jgi:hypothetical protein